MHGHRALRRAKPMDRSVQPPFIQMCVLSSKKSDTTLKFGSDLALSSNEKVRIYCQIFSQKNLYHF
jgi:hypothetical protein